MHAVVLSQVGAPLERAELPDHQPGPGEIPVRVGACGVCRTDLHAVDGELPHPQLPIIPGHEIVGRIDAVGAGVRGLTLGERVGIPWRGHTCGAGGSAETPPQRSRASAGPPQADGAPARWVAPVHRGRVQDLDAAIIFATEGALVPQALKAVRKGGRVVCAGLPMSDIPGFPSASLREERQLLSVANPTRQNGFDFLGLAPNICIVTKTTAYPLQQANQALADWRAGRFDGAAVLIP